MTGRPPSDDPLHVYSVRLPGSEIENLRRLAAAMPVPTSSNSVARKAIQIGLRQLQAELGEREPDNAIYTYEFYLHPEQPRWPFRFRELWTHEEFEEAWRKLEARGIEMHEVERYRQEPLYGWPKPMPTGRDAGAEYRSRHPDAVGELLTWLRDVPDPGD